MKTKKFTRNKKLKPSKYQVKKKKDREMTQKSLVVKRDGKIKKVDKIDLFMEELLKNGGNATRAAMKVWNPSSYSSAAVMGSRALKKAKSMSRIYMEEKGFTYGKMLDIAMDKAEAAKKPDWWDRLMKMADYEDFTTTKRAQPQVAVNVFQTHKKIASEYIDGEIEEETPKELPDEDKL